MDQFSYFGRLPDGPILEILHSLENPDLFNVIQCNSRLFRISSGLLNQRKNERFQSKIAKLRNRTVRSSGILALFVSSIPDKVGFVSYGQSLSEGHLLSIIDGSSKTLAVIPILRLLGSKEMIYKFLISDPYHERFREDEIEILMSELINADNYQLRKKEFIAEFGDLENKYKCLFKNWLYHS